MAHSKDWEMGYATAQGRLANGASPELLLGRFRKTNNAPESEYNKGYMSALIDHRVGRWHERQSFSLTA